MSKLHGTMKQVVRHNNVITSWRGGRQTGKKGQERKDMGKGDRLVTVGEYLVDIDHAIYGDWPLYSTVCIITKRL